MARSMTAYASETHVFESDFGKIELSAELKTLNSKHLDLQLRSPRLYFPFDKKLGELVRNYFSRGRVELSINRRALEGSFQEISVNLEQARKWHEAFEKLQNEGLFDGSIGLRELLQFPDWLQSKESTQHLDEEWSFLEELAQKVLEKASAEREAEGLAMKEAMKRHIQDFTKVYQEICDQKDELLKAYRERVRERVQTLLHEEKIQPERLEQEISLWIARSDFQEEVDRIDHHRTNLEDYLEKEGSIGRRIEFVIQELQREVNTLGSKCPDAKLTPHIVELKTFVERMREQVQNIE